MKTTDELARSITLGLYRVASLQTKNERHRWYVVLLLLRRLAIPAMRRANEAFARADKLREELTRAREEYQARDAELCALLDETVDVARLCAQSPKGDDVEF